MCDSIAIKICKQNMEKTPKAMSLCLCSANHDEYLMRYEEVYIMGTISTDNWIDLTAIRIILIKIMLLFNAVS